MEQRDLVERARRGDGEAFAQLVAPLLGPMLDLARVVSGSAPDAEDIVQESLTRALRALPRFDAERPFRPWFAAIVANQSRNWRRAGGRRSRLSARVAALAHPAPVPVDDAALGHDEGTLVVALVQGMEPRDREVLGLRYLVGLSERETADALGCSPGTVKSRTARALQRVREELRAREKLHDGGGR